MLYGWLLLIFLWILFLCSFPISWKALLSRKIAMQPHEELVQQIIQFKPSQKIPEYKFYHLLFSDLVSFQKRFGVSIKSSLQQMRVAINREVKFDQKLKGLKSNSEFQYLSMCCFTWFLIAHISSSLDIELDILDLMLVFFWQLIGIFIFRFFIKKLVVSYCHPFEPLFHTLYKVKCYLGSSQPLQEVKKIIEESISDGTGRVSLIFGQRLEFLLLTIRTSGRLEPSELDHLINEAWNTYEVELEKLEKSLVGVKLILFLIFIIPSYLFSITLAVGQVPV
jgi:hypothetical protein